jgi:hypothetical protein
MTSDTNGLKLLLSYNIRAEAMQSYYEFVLGRYVPMMQGLGLEMSEAWHTAYGDYPNRLIGFVSRDQETMIAALAGDTWPILNDELREYVTEFSYKVVSYQIGFQY